MQHRPGASVEGDLFIPRRQDRRHLAPGGRQPAGGQARLELVAQELLHLRDRQPQPVVQPSRQAVGAMAEVGIGQGLGHHGLEVLLARGAIVPVDRVLDDFGSQIRQQILDRPRPRAMTPLKLPAAAGAAFQLVLFLAVDPRGFGPAMPRVSGLGPGPALPLGSRRFGIHRPLARRRGRIDAGRPRQLGLQFGDPLRHRQQHQLQQARVSGRQLARLGIGQRAFQRRSDQGSGLSILADSIVHAPEIPRAIQMRKSEISESFTFLSVHRLQTRHGIPQYNPLQTREVLP